MIVMYHQVPRTVEIPEKSFHNISQIYMYTLCNSVLILVFGLLFFRRLMELLLI